MRRLDATLLTVLGVLLVHQFAYTAAAAAGLTITIAHGHFAFAWFVGSLAAVGAMGRAVTQSLRSRSFEPTNPVAMFAWIAAGYTSLELIERGVDGVAPLQLFTEPVFWLGLAFVPLVAGLLHWSVRTIATTAILIASSISRDWPSQPEPTLGRTSVIAIPAVVRVRTVSPRRGPPRK